MTTIAVNKDEMAGDSLVDDGGIRAKTTKIFRVKNDLVGLAGSLGEGLEWIEWYGSDTDDDPPTLANTNIIILKKGGQIYTIDPTGFPIKASEKFYAIGSGAPAAMGAMYAGKTPTEAVKIACKVCISTGLPVKTLKRIWK